MQITLEDLSETSVKLTINADAKDIEHIKNHVVAKMAPKVKLAGFREGKVPLGLAEKNIDQNQLQVEVIDESVNHLFRQAVAEKRVKIVAPPKIELTKFVPYTQLEFSAEVEVIGKVKLPDYKKISVKKAEVKITDKDIEEVLARLQLNSAAYTEVDRASAKGDRVWIDFEGTDDKGKAVNGAKGKDYPLALGSNTFIPGFEENIIGLKKGQNKTFTISFPADYHLKALRSKKVTFKVSVKKVEKTKLDEINDSFAVKMGPFKNLAELKDDIVKQLKIERDHQADREYEENIVKAIVAKTKFSYPDSLVEDQMDALDKDFKQSLVYRGQTLDGYLEGKGITEKEYRENELKPVAEDRLKAGLVLNEIADKENINVSPEEVEIRLQVLKNQYKSDAAMRAELNKPDNKQEIASRLITEKTILKLVDYSQK
jgi:trigger factor